MNTISQALQQVHEQISQALLRAKRPAGSVRLLAVSKTFSDNAIRLAYQAGQRAFGENYVQEGLQKIHLLNKEYPDIEWHFIGPLQSNKTRGVAESFDWVHSVDRLKVAQRLSEQRPPHLPPLNLCIQVNISDESTKSGVAPAQVYELAQSLLCLPNVRLRGLMAIPAPSPDPHIQAQAFQAMEQLFLDLQQKGVSGLDTLSMGMSSDMAVAITHGSTMVRVGTAIFGQR